MESRIERLMQTMAERLGFDLVSLRLELFGRHRTPAAAVRQKATRQPASRPAGAETGADAGPAMAHGRSAR
jgi:hypothetical protein